MDYKELIEKGISLAEDGRFEDAMKVFDKELCFTQLPAAMSYYALCMAEVDGTFTKAISLCLTAVEREPDNPDIYLNLGKIFLLKGQKSIAVKSFRKGLRFDDTHSALIAEMKRLGIRRKPIFSFLPRQNIVNKFLGRLANRWRYKAATA